MRPVFSEIIRAIVGEVGRLAVIHSGWTDRGREAGREADLFRRENETELVDTACVREKEQQRGELLRLLNISVQKNEILEADLRKCRRLEADLRKCFFWGFLFGFHAACLGIAVCHLGPTLDE